MGDEVFVPCFEVLKANIASELPNSPFGQFLDCLVFTSFPTLFLCLEKSFWIKGRKLVEIHIPTQQMHERNLPSSNNTRTFWWEPSETSS